MKTKKQLLREMSRMCACIAAMCWVSDHESDDAEQIGLSCPKLEWKLFFLMRKLKKRSRYLFARRLGQRHGDFYCHGGSDLRLAMHEWVLPEAHKRPNVIDDCWRAWCRSKP